MCATGSGRWPGNGLARRSVAVAEAANRLNRGRSGLVGIELSPQVADVELHLVAGGGNAVTPDELAELVVAQYLVRVTDEGRQEPVFEAGQGDFALVVAHRALSKGDAEPGVGVGLLGAAAAWTAEKHVHPRNQLLPSERLDHVVVGSALEPADAFQFCVTRGQHQHGDVRDLADPLQRRPAVETRHCNVENDEVGRAGIELAQADAPIRSVRDLVPRPFEERAQKPTNVVVVVDDEDPGSAHRISFHRTLRDSCVSADIWGVTASIADLGARFELARPKARAERQPPDHAVPFTLIAVVTAYALVFLPTSQLDYDFVSAAAGLSAALLGLA